MVHNPSSRIIMKNRDLNVNGEINYTQREGGGGGCSYRWMRS